jgi:hypothetical protein
MNVFYQSLTDPSDIFSFTVPATNNFNISSVNEINNRFNNLTKDYIKITGLYNDSLCIDSNP